jgi:hypothetical protein
MHEVKGRWIPEVAASNIAEGVQTIRSYETM